MAVYAAICFYIYAQEDSFKAPTWAIYIVFIIYSIFVINLFRQAFDLISYASVGVEHYSLILTSTAITIFVFVSFINIFMLPNFFDRGVFFHVCSRVCCGIVILGIPSMIIGGYTIFGVEFNPYTNLLPFRRFGIDIPAMTSFYADSNSLSKVALFGTFAGLWEYNERKTKLALALTSINGAGLYLGNSRGALLAGASGLVMYILIKKEYRNLGQLLFITGVAGSAYIIMVFAGIITGVPGSNINLSGRGNLWKATIKTIQLNPWFGIGSEQLGLKIQPFVSDSRWVGLPPQNSYLRMFLTTGIFGGSAYLLLICNSVRENYTLPLSKINPALIAFGTVIFVIQLFDNAPIFGINQSAVVISIVLGHIIYESTSSE